MRVVVSDALTTRPVEGAQAVALQLLGERPADRVVCHRDLAEPDRGPGWLGLLGPAWVPLRLLLHVARWRPAEILHAPAGGLTWVLLGRHLLLRLVSPRTRHTLVLLQSWREPTRLLARLAGHRTRVLVGNEADRGRYAAAGWSVEVVAVSAAPGTRASVGRAQARLALGLPAEGPVFLHVGHATAGRNLEALAPLARHGTLALVLSPFTPLDPAVLPSGPGVRVVHERVDVATWYAACDVYLFPTIDPGRVVGVPMSIVEARANARPVVARRSVLTERWAGDPGVRLVDSDACLTAAALAVLAAAPEMLADEAAS